MPRTPPEGKRFKKGQSGNPIGAAAHNKELKAIRRLTQADVAEIGQLILENNLAKIKEIQKASSTTVLRAWFCSVAVKAIERGDAHALNAMLDRIIGKVPNELNLTGDVNQNHTVASATQVMSVVKKLEDEY